MSTAHEDRPGAGVPHHRPPPRRPVGQGGLGTLQALQRSAGNAAVTEAVQRYSEPPKPAGITPATDPRFSKLRADLTGKSTRLKSHPTPKSEANKAKKAAVPPANDKEAQAKAAQSETMNAAKPGGFDKAAFVAAVRTAIAAQAPKNLDEADKFSDSGKADAVKSQVAGKVTEGKGTAAKDIAEKTAAAPDPSKAVEKPVVPLVQEQPPQPGTVDAAAGMPSKAPAEQTDFSAGKQETDQKMADAGVTEQQLATSNEPEFSSAVAAKKEGEQHSASAPPTVRQSEAVTLDATQKGAKADGKAGLTAMVGAKRAGLSKSTNAKGAQKAKDEAKRAEIAGQVKGIFDATKKDVDAILGGVDGEVAKRFDAGEREARAAFTADHKARMERYKDKRYSGLIGAARWTADLFTGLPAEANDIYLQSKKLYESGMERVISGVADFVGQELTKAKDRIALGRTQIKEFVARQPKDLQKVADDAAAEYSAQFDQLEADVDNKKDSLAEDLANKYVEARNSVDEEIKQAQDENKGLWDKAKEAVGGAIQTILKLKDMLLGVLARAAGAVEKIIKDPIAFLGNMVNAVKSGVVNFAGNIVEHLKKGLQGWLLGSLAEAGIELPEKFDLKGIIKVVLAILGLTWANIRSRITKQIPEAVMGKVEKGVSFIQVVITEGVGGLWKWVAEKLSDLKEMVMGQVRDFVITNIVKAGITWLISLLNPAAAFIKACKMIYDVVMFFVEKAEQIKEFVDSILDSVEAIAGGGVGAVAGYIEKTLAKTLPVVLGFLASLLGLGGISEKIKSILHTIQKPVMSVVDKLVGGAVRYGKKLMKSAQNLGKKVLGKVKAGKTWVKGKAQQGSDWAKDKYKAWNAAKPFSAAGHSHKALLKETTKGNFEILIASNEKPVAASVGLTRVAARRALVDIDQVTAATADILDRSARIRAMAREARLRSGRFPPAVVAALADLSTIVAAVWKKIGFDGERTDRIKHNKGEAGELGEVGAHKGEQGLRTDPAKAGRLREVSSLESEHVVPWSWVDAIFSKLYAVGSLPKQSGSKVYPKMTTVMQYAGAAKGKTSQAKDNSDMAVLNFLKSIPPAEAKRVLRDHLPQMIQHRMQIIRNQTVLWVAKVKREDNIILPDSPDQAAIRRAMSAQLVEIFSAARELR